MPRIYVVTTDETTGLARFGTIEVSGPDQFTADQQEPVTKVPGERGESHHPESADFNPEGLPILLTIQKGQHTIFVANDGAEEAQLVLREGDQILFQDFEPDTPPSSNFAVCYSGHASQPGPEGATLLAAVLEVRLNLDLYGYQKGLVA